MGKSTLFLTVATLALGLVLSGCSALKGTTGPDVNTAEDLIGYLSEEGISMMYHGPTANEVFTTTGQEFTVTTGGLLQIYEYNSGASALLDYSKIRGDSSIERSPHIFYAERLIVVYFGNDPKVELALAHVLGPNSA